jgi:hypothetical protein
VAKHTGKSGESLQKAIEEAYKEAMKDKPKDTGRTFRFKVEAIFVEGTNPPSDYIVEFSDAG